MINPYSYSIIYDFIESYLPTGFQKIDSKDPIIQKFESLMEQNDQFILVMNLTEVKIVYASKRSEEMVGVRPKDLTPYEMMEAVHADDLFRFGMGRSILLEKDKDLYIAQKGSSLLSTTIKVRRRNNEYSNLLFQCLMFYSPIPYKSVFEVQVHTNIDDHDFKKDRFHYYVGNDISLFRFPDKELLDLSHHLSKRELEIIRLIESGMNSKDIAEKLFLSVHTVNTHRQHMLKKSGKVHISELIYDLKDQRLL